KIVDRGGSAFRETMRGLTGQGVTFTYGGDEIVFARVTDVRAPWDLREWRDEDPEKKNRWTLTLDPDCWRRIPPDNTGYWQHRIADHIQDEYARTERSMAEVWKEDNEERSGINYGCGILQDLMLSTFKH